MSDTFAVGRDRPTGLFWWRCCCGTWTTGCVTFLEACAGYEVHAAGCDEALAS